MLLTLLILAVYTGCMSYMNLVCGLACHKSFVAQWLEHPTSVWRATASIAVGDLDFFFVPNSWHDDHIFSHFFIKLKIYLHSSFINYHDFDNEMIPLGVPGGKSGVVIVVRAQDGLEVCCPCSLPLFESNKFMPKFQLDLGHSKKRTPLCVHYQKIICHHYHLIIVIIIML